MINFLIFIFIFLFKHIDNIASIKTRIRYLRNQTVELIEAHLAGLEFVQFLPLYMYHILMEHFSQQNITFVAAAVNSQKELILSTIRRWCIEVKENIPFSCISIDTSNDPLITAESAHMSNDLSEEENDQIINRILQRRVEELDVALNKAVQDWESQLIALPVAASQEKAHLHLQEENEDKVKDDDGDDSEEQGLIVENIGITMKAWQQGTNLQNLQNLQAPSTAPISISSMSASSKRRTGIVSVLGATGATDATQQQKQRQLQIKQQQRQQQRLQQVHQHHQNDQKDQDQKKYEVDDLAMEDRSVGETASVTDDHTTIRDAVSVAASKVEGRKNRLGQPLSGQCVIS